MAPEEFPRPVEHVSVDAVQVAAQPKSVRYQETRPLHPLYAAGMASCGLVGGMAGAVTMYLMREHLIIPWPEGERLVLGLSDVAAALCLGSGLTAGELAFGTRKREMLPWMVAGFAVSAVVVPILYFVAVSLIRATLQDGFVFAFGAFAFQYGMTGLPLLWGVNLASERIGPATFQGVGGGVVQGLAALASLMITGPGRGSDAWQHPVAFLVGAVLFGLTAGLVGQMLFAAEEPSSPKISHSI